MSALFSISSECSYAHLTACILLISLELVMMHIVTVIVLILLFILFFLFHAHMVVDRLTV